MLVTLHMWVFQLSTGQYIKCGGLSNDNVMECHCYNVQVELDNLELEVELDNPQY